VVAEVHDIEMVIVTRGAEGALAVCGGQLLEATSDPVGAAEFVDSVGAGDAFSGVACLGLLEGWDPQVLLSRGNAFAGDLCRTRGATTGDRSLYERHRERWREP
jgi:fructokinase